MHVEEGTNLSSEKEVAKENDGETTDTSIEDDSEAFKKVKVSLQILLLSMIVFRERSLSRIRKMMKANRRRKRDSRKMRRSLRRVTLLQSVLLD